MYTPSIILLLAASLVACSSIPFEARAAANATAGAATGAAATGAADFGTCTPTMDFQLGRTGRKATEGTFLPTDPVVAKGQQDALNPTIITTRICDQLTNVCGADQAAKDLCLSAKATVAALGKSFLFPCHLPILTT